MQHLTAQGLPAAGSTSKLKDIVAALIGNTFEWFDFVIYGYFAAILVEVFFPPGQGIAPMLMVMATFGLGFVARPLGGLAFGLYADRYGRKRSLVLTIWLMVAGTAMIGFAPTYASAGSTGATMIAIGRLLQGFGASGEYGSAIAFLVEKAPASRRNFYVSLQMGSTMFAILLASIVGTSLVTFLSPEELRNWGWRLPFLFGLLIAPVGYYIRSKVDESSAFRSTPRLGTFAPLKELFGNHLRTLIAALCIAAMGSFSFYVTIVYMPTYAVRELELLPQAPFLGTAVAALVLIVVCPLSGYLVDRKFKLLQLLLIGAVGLAVISYPLFEWTIAEPSLVRLLTTLGLIAVPLGMVSGLLAPATSQAFPVTIRSTALSISYNLPTMLSGFSPLAVTWVVASTQIKAAPALFLIAAAIVGIIGALLLPREEKGEIHDRSTTIQHARG